MGGREASSASLLASLLRHPPPRLPFTYLLVPVEPVGGGRGEGAQVSQQPLPPQIELNGLQEPQGQAEHKSQVKGPRPARLQPGLHPSAPRGLLAGSGSQGEGELSRASRLDRITQPTGLCALGEEALCIPGKEKERWEEQLALGQKRQARVPGSLINYTDTNPNSGRLFIPFWMFYFICDSFLITGYMNLGFEVMQRLRTSFFFFATNK